MNDPHRRNVEEHPSLKDFKYRAGLALDSLEWLLEEVETRVKARYPKLAKQRQGEIVEIILESTLRLLGYYAEEI